MVSTTRTLQAQVLNHLAVLIDAGVAPVEAIAKLHDSSVVDAKHLLPMLSLLRKGSSFSSTLRASGLFNRDQIFALEIAEVSGQWSRTLKWLASDCDQQISRVKALQTRLVLPLAALCIAYMASLILGVVADKFTTGRLLSNTVVVVLIIGVSRQVLKRLPDWERVLVATFWRIDPLQRVKGLRRLYEQRFVRLLQWQISAGLTFQQSLQNLLPFSNAPLYQDLVTQAEFEIGRGNTLSTVLTDCELIFTPELVKTFEVAETSGTLDQSLEHYLLNQQQLLDITIESIFEWLPRFYYVLMLGIGFAMLH